ncbi:MAG: iron complex outermembrane receptor protein [Sulfurimonas sp.]|jgi:iron complex outermembrane receptor protein
MKKKVYLSIICVLVINLAASDLGTIQVESSTIDDKFESTKSDVSSVAVITEEEIQKINPKSIMDVLNSIPGLTASKVGTDTVKVHIRGIGNHLYMGEKPGVAVVIDGVPVQETTGKINVDLDNIASIKVIKGGASYLFGNDAEAGAVIITTKRAKGKDLTKATFEAGGFGYNKILASTNQSFENSAIQVQISRIDTDGYWDDAYLKHKSVNGKYNYYIDDSSDIVFGLDYTTRKTGDGNSVTGETNAKDDPKSTSQVSYSAYYDTTLIKTFATYSKDLKNKSNVMVNLYSYSDHTNNYTSRHRSKTYFTAYKKEEWMQNGLKSEYRKSYDSLAFMTGVDIQRNNMKNSTFDTDATYDIGDLSDKSNTDENINAVYAEVKYKLSKSLSSTINARYDHIEYDYTDNVNSAYSTNSSYDIGSYRAGLNYKINKNNNMYVSVTTGFKAPTADQLAENQEGISDGDIDSSNLEEEISYNYEIGITGKEFGLNYAASVYQLDVKNYIGRFAGSYMSTRTTETDEEAYWSNVGDMRSRGFELSLSSNQKEVVSFNMAYAYLDAIYTSYSLKQEVGSTSTYQTLDLAGNQVPRTSKHNLKLSVDYRPTSKLTISPEVVAKSSYYADETNKYEQDGYEVVNLKLNYQVNPQLKFFASVDNLLGKTYYEFVNVSCDSSTNDMEDATIRVAPTRAIYAGLSAKF